MDSHGLSIVRACRLLGCSRTVWYRPRADRATRDAPVITARQALLDECPQWGDWQCVGMLRSVGHPWNAKRIRRVYCALGLNRRRRTKRRVLTRDPQPLAAPALLNHTWALDFMGDTLYDGRCYRTLDVLDEGNREALAIEISTSLPSRRVVALLPQLVALHGAPRALRCDNGPELIAES